MGMISSDMAIRPAALREGSGLCLRWNRGDAGLNRNVAGEERKTRIMYRRRSDQIMNGVEGVSWSVYPLTQVPDHGRLGLMETIVQITLRKLRAKR